MSERAGREFGSHYETWLKRISDYEPTWTDSPARGDEMAWYCADSIVLLVVLIAVGAFLYCVYHVVLLHRTRNIR